MFRALIAAAAFAALSFGSVTASQAQTRTIPEEVQKLAPGDDVQGQPTNEEREDVQENDRFWVWVDGYCWHRWVFIGYNGFGRPVYRNYRFCS